MLEDMRRYVGAGIQALSSEAPDQLASSLMAKAQDVAEQLTALAAGFRQWSAEARESFVMEVRGLVDRQVKEMGLATQQQVQALRSRVEEAERQLRALGAPARTASRSPRTKPRTSRPRPSRKTASRRPAASTRAASRASRPSSS